MYSKKYILLIIIFLLFFIFFIKLFPTKYTIPPIMIQKTTITPTPIPTTSSTQIPTKNPITESNIIKYSDIENKYKKCKNYCNNTIKNRLGNNKIIQYDLPIPDCEHHCSNYESTTTTHPLKKCKKHCYTKSSEENALESCTAWCGYPYNFANIPLNKCTHNCFTNSNKEDSLKSCELNCGDFNNKKPVKIPLQKCVENCNTTSIKKDALKLCKVECMGSISLPSCTHYCNTTSTEIDALKSCKEFCGTKEKPVNVPLPNCKKECYTNYKK